MRLPGLVDVHVHTRDPGATHKEDWDTATAAALAGGFTCILAMPNTQPPAIDAETFAFAREPAAAKARCDFGLFVGATADNAEQVAALAPQAVGLKMYLEQTYGPLRLEEMTGWMRHFEAWPRESPIAVHAGGRTMAAVILLASLYDRPVHLCHVSRRDEILLIRAAKERGIKVTCEATPHHMLLCEDDAAAIGAGRCEVQPRLPAAADRDALWANLEVIDCFATDHAPHTLAEKDGSDPPPGLPGLETALPLLLTAVREGRLTMEQLVQRLSEHPRQIFHLAKQPDTFIEIDPDCAWELSGRELHTRCGWTPFEGWKVHGRVRRVVVRGQDAFRDGRVLAPRGFGRQVQLTK
jgi:dihydroorotase-like cyclic amidohydrolase